MKNCINCKYAEWSRTESGRLHPSGDGHGQRHRADGPAVEHPDGSRAWWVNGQLHRADGPAIEHPDGYRAWWVNGKFIRSEIK